MGPSRQSYRDNLDLLSISALEDMNFHEPNAGFGSVFRRNRVGLSTSSTLDLFIAGFVIKARSSGIDKEEMGPSRQSYRDNLDLLSISALEDMNFHEEWDSPRLQH
jgi:hypothetical protein